MQEPGDVRPRRALPPREDEDAPGSEPRPEDGSYRRGWAPTEPGESASPDAGTLIPPPAVLPRSSDASASAGRRFSADDFGDEADRPLPRRSAVSPSGSRTRSPETADDADAVAGDSDAAAGGTARATAPSGAPPAGTGAVQPGASADRGTGGGRRPWLLGAAALAVLVLAVAAIWSQSRGGLPIPAATPTPTVDPVATYLAQPDDLAGLRDTTWAEVATVADADASAPRAVCLLPTAELDPAPADTMVRTFAPTAGAAGGALHQVDRFETPEEAASAYARLLGQLANCDDRTAWAQAGHDVTGLADESSAMSYVVQSEAAEYHAVLLARTGTRVNTLDVTAPDVATPMQAVAQALANVTARQCADNGACPTGATVVDAVPPVADPPGWLADVDLPRITPGSGTWRGTDIAPMRLAGTRCEAVDLNAVAAASGAQRTYVLADDTNAPQGFGVDEAVWTFNSVDEATAFANTLWANTDGCPNRTGTATVERTGEFSGVGSVVLYAITQPVDANTSARFRSAVIARDQRVVYLMANPSAAFDFSNETWSAIATRAGQRLTQLP